MPDKNSILLKKYSNRRLYDTEKSAYVTLSDVARMIREGRWVSVVDADTDEDVTAFTLTQIIMEEAKKKNALLPVPLLHLVIRYGENILADFFDKHLEKMIASYVSYKTMADEQFNRWLEMGTGLTDAARKSMPENSPFHAFFRQFFPGGPAGGDAGKKPEGRKSGKNLPEDQS
jgi:polyhydroxyalkanoate synthesis repressor PhaR